jgi:hypothetical protein
MRRVNSLNGPRALRQFIRGVATSDQRQVSNVHLTHRHGSFLEIQRSFARFCGIAAYAKERADCVREVPNHQSLQLLLRFRCAMWEIEAGLVFCGHCQVLQGRSSA